MVKSSINTSVVTNSPLFNISMGDGYTIISLNPHRTTQIMIKTADIAEFQDALNTARETWAKAKAAETQLNS